jgi:hypothetical protein
MRNGAEVMRPPKCGFLDRPGRQLSVLVFRTALMPAHSNAVGGLVAGLSGVQGPPESVSPAGPRTPAVSIIVKKRH